MLGQRVNLLSQKKKSLVDFLLETFQGKCEGLIPVLNYQFYQRGTGSNPSVNTRKKSIVK